MFPEAYHFPLNFTANVNLSLAISIYKWDTVRNFDFETLETVFLILIIGIGDFSFARTIPVIYLWNNLQTIVPVDFQH